MSAEVRWGTSHIQITLTERSLEDILIPGWARRNLAIARGVTSMRPVGDAGGITGCQNRVRPFVIRYEYALQAPESVRLS